MPKATRAPITAPGPVAVPTRTPDTAPLDAAPNRRRLFRALAGAALAGSAAPAAAAHAIRQAHPDAKLIQLCDELVALTAEIETYYEGPSAIEDDDERDEELEPLRAREHVLTRQIASLPAVTASGLRAKAGAYITWDVDFLSCPYRREYSDELLRASIIRDATRIRA